MGWEATGGHVSKQPFEIGENLAVLLMLFSIFGVPALAVAWIVWTVIRGGCP